MKNLSKIAVLLAPLLFLFSQTAQAQTITRRADLAWGASATPAPPLLGYVVERATGSSTAQYTRLNTAPQTATTFSDQTIQASTTYWYRVIAVCPATGSTCIGESDPTPSAQAVVPSDPVKPGTPGNVTVTVTVEVNVSQ